MENKKPLLAVALLCAAGFAHAGEKEELLKLRNTTTSLIKQLVKQGILTAKAAEEMIKQAEADAEQQTAQAKASASASGKTQEATDPDEVRVTYVPDFVKDEIRQQVRSELREEVVGDVLDKAKKEQWGLPNALPEWTRRFKLSGDLRLREQAQLYGQVNQAFSYFDFQSINNAGGILTAGQNAFLNTTNDRNILRERLRLSLDANIAEGWNANVRLATGNIRNPTSTNQDLGNTGQRYQFNIDRAYVKYDGIDENRLNWLSVAGGRIQNPWFTGGSELVWDEDLSFEGVAATVRQRFFSGSNLDDVSPNAPVVFATAGAFPIQASSTLGSRTKWLFGGQVGLDWGFSNQNSLKAGLAYYDYENIRARVNNNTVNTCDTNSIENTQSVPQSLQFGNSLTSICNEGNINNPGGAGGLLGLASGFNIINANVAYDIANLAPVHIKISGDFAKNVGADRNAINLAGNTNFSGTNAWQFKLDAGWPKIDRPGNWGVFASYKRVESDSVLDAFTDSDFHLGGTNVRGWTIGGNYGLAERVWLTGRWLTGSVITGPTFDLDVLQVDLNTRF
ncbi:MAG: putative porin [Methylococcaceae bacterium]|jgi:hypothetical protein